MDIGLRKTEGYSYWLANFSAVVITKDQSRISMWPAVLTDGTVVEPEVRPE
jgi:hypothetical protein